MKSHTTNILLHSLFGLAAGLIYVGIELAWRGHTHWTMCVLAAIIFVLAGSLDEHRRPPPFWAQVLIGAVIATALELAAGLILNVWLGLGIWDYSNMSGNVLGQICPQYSVAWAGLMVIAIKLENLMHRAADCLLAKMIKRGRIWNILHTRKRP